LEVASLDGVIILINDYSKPSCKLQKDVKAIKAIKRIMRAKEKDVGCSKPSTWEVQREVGIESPSLQQ
jgi:hypothetical protein